MYVVFFVLAFPKKSSVIDPATRVIIKFSAPRGNLDLLNRARFGELNDD